MTPLTPNEKLDFVLNYINRQRTYTELSIEIDSHANIQGQFFPGELDLIMDKLRKDGYIDFIAGANMVSNMKANEGLEIRRNFEGTVFIKDGGYVSKHDAILNEERIKNNREKQLSFGTVLLAIGTFLIIAWEMYKTFVIEHHSPC